VALLLHNISIVSWQNMYKLFRFALIHNMSLVITLFSAQLFGTGKTEFHEYADEYCGWFVDLSTTTGCDI
jgi:hypothetical protein